MRKWYLVLLAGISVCSIAAVIFAASPLSATESVTSKQYLPIIRSGNPTASRPSSTPSGPPSATATAPSGSATATPTLTPTSTPSPIPGPIIRASLSSSGDQGGGDSQRPAISSDGRYIAFDSLASNLVADDTNNVRDIFVHDRQTGTTTRVSVASNGDQADGKSFSPSLSADGRFVAFRSDAGNLVEGDTNGSPDIFVHDRDTGVTTRVSVSSAQAEANDASLWPAISADGNSVAFYSLASNLVPNDTNGQSDVFVHNRLTGVTSIVSVSSSGAQGNGDSTSPAISNDGRYVAFYSWATDLVDGVTDGMPDILVHDRQTGETTRVSKANDSTASNGLSGALAISADGRIVAFSSNAGDLVAGDTNGTYDIFVYDRLTGATTRPSVGTGGVQANGASDYPSLSVDGRYVTFESAATNLVADDTNNVSDVFVHDLQTGETRRLSVPNSGGEADQDSRAPAISADGCSVAFHAAATNLVSGDSNGAVDVFVYDCH